MVPSLSRLSRAFQLVPPKVRGKSRLARFLLPKRVRKRGALIRDRSSNVMLLPNLIEPVGWHLWIDGIYESEVLDFLQRHTTSDSVVLDVGANIGAFTLPLARRAKQVVAIEPSPEVLLFLKRNIEINALPNVTVVNCAASEPGTSTISFYPPPMEHFGMGSSAPQFGVPPITVGARSIDEILKDLGVSRVGVMKVDVEGYEAHVFLGAHGLLRSAHAPPIVFETSKWAEERAFPGRSGWAQEVLVDAGYALWTLYDYLHGGAPLKGLSTEADMLVGIPAHMLP